MNTLAFAVLALMLTVYVLLDGYDLGIAALSLFVAKTDAERGAMMRAVGPFVHGNEVWLVASGGALFALFPQAYAVAFSGFYLPFILVLWLLMGRGVALELRGHLVNDMWHQFWDVAFSISSGLLILIFGVALANLLRGVPLGANGYFQGTFGYLLNPYALLVGVFAILALVLHGATFLMLRVDGPPSDRTGRVLRILPWIALVGFIIVTGATFAVRGAPVWSWIDVLPLASVAALLVLIGSVSRGAKLAAFAASSAWIVTMLIEAAVTMFPYLLPSYPLGGGLSIYDAAPSSVGLVSALSVIVIGIVVVAIYGKVLLKMFAAKVIVNADVVPETP